jgi:hypothetical protein
MAIAMHSRRLVRSNYLSDDVVRLPLTSKLVLQLVGGYHVIRTVMVL